MDMRKEGREREGWSKRYEEERGRKDGWKGERK